VNGRYQVVAPEGEFIPGETIAKLYYCKRLNGYVTIAGASLVKVTADRSALDTLR